MNRFLQQRRYLKGRIFRIFLVGIVLLLANFRFSFGEESRLSLRDASILGAIQGATEFLPVSSTGHLILAEEWLDLSFSAEESSALADYNVIIQGGSILAVALLYRRRFGQMWRGVFSGNRSGRRLIVNLLVAFLPAALLGFFLDGPMQAACYRADFVAWMLILGGVYLIGFEIFRGRFSHQQAVEELTWRQSLIIGCWQCLALFPGVSRSLMTLTGGIWVGLSAVGSAEFSFLLGFVTLSAASIYKILFSPMLWATFSPSSLLWGCLVAFLSSVLAIRFLIYWLGHHTLLPFGVYRILFALAILL